MRTPTKANALREQGVSGDAINLNRPKHTPASAKVKNIIVQCALWGLIPASFATWLIQRGGLKDA